MLEPARSAVLDFCLDVAKSRLLWTVGDETGFHAVEIAPDQFAQPFWSSRVRARSFLAAQLLDAELAIFEIAWHQFREAWSPALEQDAILVGIDWRAADARLEAVPARALQEQIQASIVAAIG